MPMLNLKLNKLSLHYNQPLLDRVDAYASGQQVIALIGDNGCGKSTLLKIIAGIEEPLNGEVIWSQEASIGYMQQELDEQSTMSGGQKKIAILSELIYSNSHDVLLLDEPDNHLDLEGKQWLEDAIKSFSGLIIVISHDRQFLENITDNVWLIEDRTLKMYPFGFAKFQEEYAQNLATQRKKYQIQLKEKQRLEEMVRLFLIRIQEGKVKPSAYRNVVHRLEHHLANMIPDPDRNSAMISLKSDTSSRMIKGKTAILVKDLSFGFVKDNIFDDANLHLSITDKASLVSPNGSGKTTLIKLLLKELEPSSGSCWVGPNLKIGYYSQDHTDALDQDLSPIKTFTLKFPMQDYHAEAILKRFLFTKATMKSKVSQLSGGQKARLQLALFLYTNPDVLILDEPTNHLDLKSITALEDFLLQFQGSLLLISHDRQLIQNLGVQVYEIKDKKIIQSKSFETTL